MNDMHLHHEGPERPSQDWTGGPESDPRYARLHRAVEALTSGSSPERQRAFEVIRSTLEDAGIPFIRANELAERCYKALAEIL